MKDKDGDFIIVIPLTPAGCRVRQSAGLSSSCTRSGRVRQIGQRPAIGNEVLCPTIDSLPMLPRLSSR